MRRIRRADGWCEERIRRFELRTHGGWAGQQLLAGRVGFQRVKSAGGLLSLQPLLRRGSILNPKRHPLVATAGFGSHEQGTARRAHLRRPRRRAHRPTEGLIPGGRRRGEGRLGQAPRRAGRECRVGARAVLLHLSRQARRHCRLTDAQPGESAAVPRRVGRL